MSEIVLQETKQISIEQQYAGKAIAEYVEAGWWVIDMYAEGTKAHVTLTRPSR